MGVTEIGFGNFGNVEAKSAYASSFGAMKDETCYYNPQFVGLKSMESITDLRPQLKSMWEAGVQKMSAEKKSAQFDYLGGGAGSTDRILIPLYLDPRVVDITRKFTPLCELIPRVSNQGRTAEYNSITAKTSVAAFKNPGDALAAGTVTSARGSKAMKYLYAIAEVDGQAQVMFPSYTLMGFQPSGSGLPGSNFGDQAAPNASQLSMLTAVRALKEVEEDAILNGNSSSAPAEFDGLIVQLNTNQSNPASGSGGDIALADINAAVKDAFDDGGRPSLAVCNSRTYTDVLDLLNAKIGYLQPAKQVYWGFSAIVLNTMVGEVVLIPSMFLSNTVDAGKMLFLDMSVIEMRVLLDLTVEKLAKTNDVDRWMLKEYLALIVRAPSFCAVIQNID